MPFLERVVKKVGNTAHVLLPKKYLGQKVIIETEDDIDELKELITTTLLYRKVYKADQDSVREEFEDFKRQVFLRLKNLEKVVYSES